MVIDDCLHAHKHIQIVPNWVEDVVVVSCDTWLVVV